MYEGHRERLKERFLKDGLDSFEQHNILELALFYAIPRKDTNEIAHRLIDAFGSVSGVFDAPFEQLIKIDGIGENSACFIKLIPELARCYYNDLGKKEVTVLNSTDASGAFFVPKFIGRTDEYIFMAALDGKCRLLCCEPVGKGVVNEVNVSIRKIVEVAMKYNAVSVIIAHNHPNGVALPSSDDIDTTWRIVDALTIVNVKLLDHIIVAGNDYVSLRDSKQYAYIFNRTGKNKI